MLDLPAHGRLRARHLCPAIWPAQAKREWQSQEKVSRRPGIAGTAVRWQIWAGRCRGQVDAALVNPCHAAPTLCSRWHNVFGYHRAPPCSKNSFHRIELINIEEAAKQRLAESNIAVLLATFIVRFIVPC